MGETARERFHRMQQEKAAASGEAAASKALCVAEASGRSAASPVALIKGRFLEKRREELGRRLNALGAPVLDGELPTDEEDIADLERFCDEQERGK